MQWCLPLRRQQAGSDSELAKKAAISGALRVTTNKITNKPRIADILTDGRVFQSAGWPSRVSLRPGQQIKVFTLGIHVGRGKGARLSRAPTSAI